MVIDRSPNIACRYTKLYANTLRRRIQVAAAMARHACTNPPTLSQLFTETLLGKVAAVVYDFNVALPRANTLPSPRSVKWNTRKISYISFERGGFVLSNNDLEQLIFQYLLSSRFFFFLYIYIYFLSWKKSNMNRQISNFRRGNFTNLIFSEKHSQHILTQIGTKENSNSTYEGDHLY